jgi:hypothetical protein
MGFSKSVSATKLNAVTLFCFEDFIVAERPEPNGIYFLKICEATVAEQRKLPGVSR